MGIAVMGVSVKKVQMETSDAPSREIAVTVSTPFQFARHQ